MNSETKHNLTIALVCIGVVLLCVFGALCPFIFSPNESSESADGSSQTSDSSSQASDDSYSSSNGDSSASSQSSGGYTKEDFKTALAEFRKARNVRAESDYVQEESSKVIKSKSEIIFNITDQIAYQKATFFQSVYQGENQFTFSGSSSSPVIESYADIKNNMLYFTASKDYMDEFMSSSTSCTGKWMKRTETYFRNNADVVFFATLFENDVFGDKGMDYLNHLDFSNYDSSPKKNVFRLVSNGNSEGRYKYTADFTMEDGKISQIELTSLEDGEGSAKFSNITYNTSALSVPPNIKNSAVNSTQCTKK